MALIECKNLSLAYEGQNVVDGLTFEVSTGDYLCIIGKNGGGKTTLVKSIVGLHKPFNGEIKFTGGLSKSDIGYMPQKAAAKKDFPASVYEVVMSGFTSSQRLPFYTKKEKLKADENLRLLGISHLKKSCYNELSGGQQQRVLLSRALCAAKRLLVLDEPASGLDPAMTGEFYSLVKKLNKESRITVIMVSHDVKRAIKHASHILHLDFFPQYFGTAEGYLESAAGKRFLGGDLD